MALLGYGTNELLSCFLHGVQKGTVSNIQIDVQTGSMTVTFGVTSELVKEFVDAMEETK